MPKRKLYERFTYSVVWSEEDKSFVASVKEFPSLKVNNEDNPIYALEELYDLIYVVVNQMRRKKEKVPNPIGYLG